MCFGNNKEVLDAELWAIAEGFKIARELTVNIHNTPVTIFSDSQEGLTAIGQLASGTSSSYLRNLIYQRTFDLGSNGYFITLGWIPSHVGLMGHDRADQIAEDRARRGGKPVEQWSLTSRKSRMSPSLKSWLGGMKSRLRKGNLGGGDFISRG